MPGKQVFVTEILIDKNLTLIIPEQMRTRDLNQNYSLKFRANCYSASNSCLFGRVTESHSIPLVQNKNKIIELKLDPTQANNRVNEFQVIYFSSVSAPNNFMVVDVTLSCQHKANASA